MVKLVTLAALVALVGLAAAALTCKLDPVHDDAVSDLGDEVAGIPRGPLHRAGQPCLTCHDGSTASPAMSVAGTVYGVLGDATPFAGADVLLTDVNGSTFTGKTNAAGNFYVEQSAWQPTYPLHVVVGVGKVQATMSSIIGRDGSCASCHVDPPSRISAGRVYLVPVASLLPDGGAP
ncbi:MAG TPA: hypothetical protein VNO21_06275 [Polyangiaceae bacterium]|nr:hypothetical protein [Polyangiaceae bacterium]